MSNSNGVITAPVSIADVQKVLGVSDNNIGALCKSEKINILSRHKPLRFSDLFMPGSDMILNQNWANGADKGGNAGGLIRIWQSTAANATLLTYLNNTQDETFLRYDRPIGGVNDPYRLADFQNYSHKAQYAITGEVPWKVEISVNNWLGGSILMNIKLGAYLEQSDRTYLLSGEEVMQSNVYHGVLILRSNGDTSLSNSYQFGGWDFIFVTTQKYLSQYASGNTVERTYSKIYKVDEYQYSLEFALPKQSGGSLSSSTGYFDSFVGKDIRVYPIISDAPFFYLDIGSSTAKIAKNAFDANHYPIFNFTLQPESASGQYKRPSVALSNATTTITYDGGIASVRLDTLRITLTSKGGTRTLAHNIRSISTAVVVSGKDSNGNTVSIYKTLQEGSWTSNTTTISVSYVSGTATSRDLTLGTTATVREGKSGLTNPSAVLRVSVGLYQSDYKDTYDAVLDIPVSLNSNYL